MPIGEKTAPVEKYKGGTYASMALFMQASNDFTAQGYTLSSWHPQLERVEHNGGDGTKVVTVYHAIFVNHEVSAKAPAPEPMRAR